jgi:hypothetical protein
MTQTVRGIFHTPAEAERAVADLIAGGIPKEQISMIGPGSAEAAHVKVAGSGVEHVEDVAIGAIGGGLLGGVLGAVVAMAIPGLGLVLVAGPLAAAIGAAGASMVVGAGAGAVGGGILGALAWAGITDDEAHVYEELIHQGGTLVMVQAAGHERELAAAILHRDGAADAIEIEAEWRREGRA